MLLLRGYEKWCGVSFLGDHFRAVAIGRKLYVIFIVCLGSAFLFLYGFSLCVLDNFYFCFCVEIWRVFCKSTDACVEVTDLDADILQEGAALPSPHDNDFSWIHFVQIEFHGKPW